MLSKRLVPLLILLLLLGLTTLVLAQSSADFDLSWHVIGNGGGRSASADYVVQGTIGQAIVGPPASTGSDFRLNSGFWYPAQFELYLPVTANP